MIFSVFTGALTGGGVYGGYIVPANNAFQSKFLKNGDLHMADVGFKISGRRLFGTVFKNANTNSKLPSTLFNESHTSVGSIFCTPLNCTVALE